MRQGSILLFLVLLFVNMKTKAQLCPVENGYYYSIYVFSSKNNKSLNELLGAKYDPMIFHVIQIKNNDERKRIDKLCLTRRMDTSIFVYSSKDKIIRFCTQQEYLNALKSKMELSIE